MKQTRQPFEICLLPPCHWKHWRILTWLFIILKTLFSAFQLHILQNTYMKERRHPELICRHINKLAVTQYMCIADASLYSILLMHSDKRSYWIIYNFDSPEEEWREFREVFNYQNYCHLLQYDSRRYTKEVQFKAGGFIITFNSGKIYRNFILEIRKYQSAFEGNNSKLLRWSNDWRLFQGYFF